MTQPSANVTTPLSDDQPPNTYIMVTGIPIDQQPAAVTNLVVLPNDGTIWVGYEYATDPAVYVEIWHQGGAFETVPPGFNTFKVGATDILTYGLNDASQSIKLGWAYI